MDSQAVTVTLDERNMAIGSWEESCKWLSSLKVGESIAVEQPWTIIAHLREVLAVLEDVVERDEVRDADAEQVCLSVKEEMDEEEVDMRKKLNALQEQWRRELRKADFNMEADFNMDGFYPCYAKQKLRILFVGREAYGMKGKNYIDTQCDQLKNGKIGKWTVDQYPFHKRQFYIAYGLLASVVEGSTGFPDWKDVPWASDLAKILFARCKRDAKAFEKASIKPVETLSSLSWAFMNLSKLSNETGDWRTDERRYRPFVEDETNQKFIRDEIRILRPDVIIGSNVYDLVKILEYAKVDKGCSPNCDYYESGNKKWPPFINCYHFSAIKKDKECYYEAVREVVNNVGFGKFDWENNLEYEQFEEGQK